MTKRVTQSPSHWRGLGALSAEVVAGVCLAGCLGLAGFLSRQYTADALTRPAKVVAHPELPRQAAYAKGELIVKFHSDGPHRLNECLHCVLAKKRPVRSALADGSHAVDALNRKAGVKAARSVFVEQHGLTIEQVKRTQVQRIARVRKQFPQRTQRAPQQGQTPLQDLTNTYVLSVPEETDIEALCAEYRALPQVDYCQPNYLVETNWVPNDPYYSSSNSWGQGYDDLWGLKNIQAEQAWDITKGEGIVVSVIDTGLDYLHPDIAANVWVNPSEDLNANGVVDGTNTCPIPNGDFNCVDDDANGYVDDLRGWDFTTCALGDEQGYCLEEKARDGDVWDGDGHGTHVSGTIAAAGNNGIGVIGVAPHATLMSLKGLNDQGAGRTSDLADAIVYAAEQGADVLNNSWGCSLCSSNTVAEAAVRTAHSLGAVVVFSAGNSSAPVLFFSPQNMPEVITVASTDHLDQRSDFSNYGPEVDLAAPGGESGDSPNCEYGAPSPEELLLPSILSLRARGTDMYLGCSPFWEGQMVVGDDYYRARGTSMAAPHVAGAAALVLAHRPTWTTDDVQQVLKASADDIALGGANLLTGAGRLNAAGALAVDTLLRVSLTSPANWTNLKTLGASVSITGTAAGPGFQDYQLLWGRGLAPTEWTPIGAPVTTPVEEGALGTWALGNVMLEPDVYLLRLVATSTSGGRFQTITPVTVEEAAQQLPFPDSFPADWLLLQGFPAISGERMVWNDNRQDSSDIFLYDLATHQEHQITAGGGGQFHPAISSGDWIVWEEHSSLRSDIAACQYHPDTGACPKQLITADQGEPHYCPTVSGAYVVWQDGSNSLSLSLYDLSTAQEQRLTSDQAYPYCPAISGNRIVWYDFHEDAPGVYLCAYDAATGQCPEQRIASGLHYGDPAISGDRVVWWEIRNDRLSLALYNVGTGQQQRIAMSHAVPGGRPSVSGDWIVWEDYRESPMTMSDLYLYDVATGEERRLTTHPASSSGPAISGNRIVWSDDRTGDLNIFYATYTPDGSLLGRITSPNEGALFGPHDSAVTIIGTAAGTAFQRYELFYGAGDAPASWIPITGPVATPVQEGVLGTWPLTGQADGVYTLKLVVTATDGRQRRQQARVLVNPLPQAQITSPTPGTVAVVGALVPILGTAAGDAFTSYQLFSATEAPEPVWAAISQPMTTPVINGLLGTWSTAGLSSETNYLLKVVVTSSTGRQAEAVVSVHLRAVQIEARITAPEPGAIFTLSTGSVAVTGTAAGADFKHYQLFYAAEATPSQWISIAGPVETPVEDNLLGTWMTSGLSEGLYTLVLQVTPVTGQPLVQTSSAMLRGDVQAAISQPLPGTIWTQTARQALEIRGTAAGGDFTSYTLWYGAGAAPTQWHLITGPVASPVEAGMLGIWEAAALPAGSYTIKLEVTGFNGQLRLSVVTVLFSVVDLLATLLTPTPGQQISASQGTVTITGTAAGANFASYRLFYGVGANPTSWSPITSAQTTPVTDGVLGNWLLSPGMPSGPYQLKLVVTKQGGGTAQDTVSVSIVLPLVAALMNPTEGQLISVRDGSIAVFGTAGGLDFQSYQLFYRDTSQGGPGPWTPIGAPSTAPVTVGTLGTWLFDGLPLGAYQLKLAVNGPEAAVEEDVVSVVIREDLLAMLTSPLSHQVIDPSTTEEVEITGTAAGADFASYQLFYGQEIAGFVNWVAIAPPVTSPVTDGILGTWPLTGLSIDQYWVKLVVTGLLGGTSEAQRGSIVLEDAHQRITTDPEWQDYPAISGHRIVWEDSRNQQNIDIYLFDLDTGEERPITTAPAHQFHPAIADDLIAWIDTRHDRLDLYSYDLATGTERRITTDAAMPCGDEMSGPPAVSSNRIVWVDCRDGTATPYLYDLATGQEQRLTTDAVARTHPAISGDLIVWEKLDECISGGSSINIFLFDLSTRQEQPMARTDCDMRHHPAISGSRIVWEENDDGINPEIHLYEITTGREETLTVGNDHEYDPVISGNLIVWRHMPYDADYTLFAYDAGTGQGQPLAAVPFAGKPAVSDNRVVWSEDRGGDGNYDIYMAELAITPLPPILERIDPSAGEILSIVELQGAHFGASQESSEVRVNGVSVTPVFWADDHISAMMPAQATSGDLTVTTSVGTSNSMSFTVLPPAITALHPPEGSHGSLVTIQGEHLGTDVPPPFGVGFPGEVRFNGVPATSIESWTYGSITIGVPEGATSGPVTVTTLNGYTSNGVAFRVLPLTVLSLTDSPDPFYPNAGQKSTISFTLSEPASVTLKLYTGAGSLIGTYLYNELKPQGTSTVIWDGLSRGTPYPNGTYTYKLWSTDAAGTRHQPPYPATGTITLKSLTTPGGGTPLPCTPTTTTDPDLASAKPCSSQEQ